jgi:ClpP class serine protease
MPSWNDIFVEINQNPYDVVRKKHIDDLFRKTGRNLIAYYSAFLTKSGFGLSLDDSDMAGYMSAIHGMDRSKGLDLILHTPGGNPIAKISPVIGL